MKFLKKWGLIAAIFLGSYIVLTIIALLLNDFAGVNLVSSIVGIYAAILMLWFIFMILKTIFKGSSFLMRRYYLFLAKFYFKKKYPQVNLSEFSTMRLFKMCNVKARFPDLDIPLLDDKEIDRLNKETNIMNAKSAAKATLWATKTTAKAAWWTAKTTTNVVKGTGDNFTKGYLGTEKKIRCINCGCRLKVGLFGRWEPYTSSASKCYAQGKNCVGVEDPTA
jgi:hypothetical protein